MAYYLNPLNCGTDALYSFGDGQTINVKWFKAYASNPSNKIAYHIYFSKNNTNVFSEGVKFVIFDDETEANLINLTPGQNYYIAVRPVEFDSSIYKLSELPLSHDNLYVYPESLLASDITESDLIIPVEDVSLFPSFGVVIIGKEIIKYSSIDTLTNSLILNDISQRGYSNTEARIHLQNGFDGYSINDPNVKFKLVVEDIIYDRIYMCQSRFEYPNNAFTLVDGYHQVTKDILSTDLSASDIQNENFPVYDYSGYHRTDPVQLLNGECVGSYIGGEFGCIDGYGNVNIIRGLSLQEQNNQKQEIMFSMTGRVAVLLRRVNTGITCSCYLSSSEYPDDRCPRCFGTKFVIGYEQYFNPRRSDGRILVRVGPSEENTKMYESGLESELPLDFETLTVPTIKTRDVIILFDVDGNEEFRYEVTSVTRNNTILGFQGAQKFRAVRIRKTDVAYQINAFKDTSTMPSTLNTSLTLAIGIGLHSHKIVRNENNPNTWSQLTSVASGHNHQVVFENGKLIVKEALGHTHDIVII